MNNLPEVPGETQSGLHLQPFAGQQDAGLAQQVRDGLHRAGLHGPGRACGLGAGDRQRFLPAPGRGPLCPDPGAVRQPRAHPGPQWTDPGLQRAGGQHLVDPRRRGEEHPGRPGQAAQAGQADGHAFGPAEKEAGRGQELCLGQAPAGLGCGSADQGPGHQGHLPDPRIQAPIPRRRGGGPHRGLHERRGQGPGRHGTGLRKGPGGQARLAPCDQGPPGARGRWRGRRGAPDRWPRHPAVGRQQDPVLCLPEAQGAGAGPQGRGRHGGGHGCQDR